MLIRPTKTGTPHQWAAGKHWGYRSIQTKDLSSVQLCRQLHKTQDTPRLPTTLTDVVSLKGDSKSKRHEWVYTNNNLHEETVNWSFTEILSKDSPGAGTRDKQWAEVGNELKGKEMTEEGKCEGQDPQGWTWKYWLPTTLSPETENDQQTRGDCWRARTGLERTGELCKRNRVLGVHKEANEGECFKKYKAKGCRKYKRVSQGVTRSSSQKAFPSYRWPVHCAGPASHGSSKQSSQGALSQLGHWRCLFGKQLYQLL